MKEKTNINKQANHGDLTFLDGILLTKRIYDMVLKKQLSNEKDKQGYSYLGIIKDDIMEQIDNQVLYNYFRDHGDQLCKQFGIDI